MNVQSVISNMKRIIPEIRDTVTKDKPIYRVLKHRETHRRVVELALALGERRLLKYIGYLNINKDFTFDDRDGYYCIKCYTSVLSSDFFREVYKDILHLNNDDYLLTIFASGDIKVFIDLTHEEIKGNYRFKYYIPMITFETSTEKIVVTRGVVRTIRPAGYREIKIGCM